MLNGQRQSARKNNEGDYVIYIAKDLWNFKKIEGDKISRNFDFKNTGDTQFFQGFYDNEIIQTLQQIKNLGFLILQNCVSAIFLC